MDTNENGILADFWYAEINNIVKQTTFEELKVWIKEGKLQPTDKVMVRNLSWVEAQKVPAFQKLFAPDEINTSVPPNSLPNHSLIESQALHKTYPPNNSSNDSLSDLPLSVKPLSVVEINNVKPSVRNSPEKPSSLPPSYLQSVKDDISENPGIFIAGTKKSDNLSASPTAEHNTDSGFETKLSFSENGQANSKESTTSQDHQRKSAESKPLQNKRKVLFPQAYEDPQILFKPRKRFQFYKSVSILLFGSCLMVSIAWGAAYLFVYQFGLSGKIDEKSISELIILEEKLTTDKVGARLKVAESERAAAAALEQGNTQPKLDLAQEISKLEKLYNSQRTTIVESHQANYLSDTFNRIFYGGSVLFIVLFVLVRVSTNKTNKTFADPSPRKLPTNKDAERQTLVIHRSDTQQTVSVHTTKPSNVHTTQTADYHITNQANINLSNSPGEGVFAAFSEQNPHTGISDVSNVSKNRHCLLHQEKPSEFVCEKCANYFCGDCVEVVNSAENNCPFCKTVCKIFSQPTTKMASGKTETFSNIDISDVPGEKIQKVGIITALIISLFLSVPMSYLWVYEITPRMEKGELIIPQKTPEAETEPRNC